MSKKCVNNAISFQECMNLHVIKSRNVHFTNYICSHTELWDFKISCRSYFAYSLIFYQLGPKFFKLESGGVNLCTFTLLIKINNCDSCAEQNTYMGKVYQFEFDQRKSRKKGEGDSWVKSRFFLHQSATSLTAYDYEYGIFNYVNFHFQIFTSG